MKLQSTQENLSKGLNYIIKAVSSNPSIPVLANVLIETTKDELKLSATDLELGVTTTIGADIKKEGKITVDARTLAEFVHSLSPGKLDIELKDKVFLVESKSNSAEFNVIDADEFPPLPQAGKTSEMKLNALNFSGAINQVTISAAADDSRPVLTGTLFDATKRKLSMVGVDGFRLSKKTLKISRKKDTDFKHIVPAKALQELARVSADCCDKEDEVEVYLLKDKNQMLFKVKDIELSTRLIEGEFPDYEQIMPKETKYKFGVEKESFEKTIKVVSIFARSAVGNKALFDFDPEKSSLKLSAQVADVGENESTVEVFDTEGDKMKTAFNTRFLLDMIGIMEGDEILFESNGVTAPGVFKDKDDEDFLHIIMPMRTD